MYHKAPVSSAPITNAANAMPITVRVSRPWKISIMIRNQCILWVSQHHMLQFYIRFTSIIRKAENQLINSEDKKWIPTKYTIFVTCKYFLKIKMKFSDFQDTFSLQFTLSIKLLKSQICQLCKTLGLWWIASVWGYTIWRVKGLESQSSRCLGK